MIRKVSEGSAGKGHLKGHAPPWSMLRPHCSLLGMGISKGIPLTFIFPARGHAILSKAHGAGLSKRSDDQCCPFAPLHSVSRESSRMPSSNRTPEQEAREKIDGQLSSAGWTVQDLKRFDHNAGPGIAVREYPTDVGPADYVSLSTGKQSAWSRPNRRSGAIKSRRSRNNPELMRLHRSSG